MLQNIRDKSQGVLAWIVVILIISTFALWGVHDYVTSGGSSKVPAYVNHTPITDADVMTAYERLRQQEQMQLGANFSLNQQAEKALKAQALNQLVLSNVLIDAAYKAGYRVTTGQVDEALLQVPAFQENGQFSVNRFHEVLSGILYSQSAFLQSMRNSMLINQVKGGYVNSAFALPGEIDTAVRLINQKRDISYVIIPAAHFSNNVQVSNTEIKSYYQAHQSDFQSPEHVSIQYLELSLPQIKSGLHFDETKLQQYYENNTQNYTTPASWHVDTILVNVPKNASPADVEGAQKKIDDIESQLKAGANFEALARKESDDPVSASKGGELPWFSAGTLDPSFEKATAALTVGEVSAPVRTAYGFSIIKLLGVKKAEVMPFAQVRSQVENTLAEQQAEQTFADESDKLSNLTYSNPTSLEVAAKALNIPIQTSDLFSRTGTKTGLTSNPRVIAAAFSQDVLQNGNNSDLLQLDPNTVIVLRVKDHQPQSVLPFADVEGTIQAKLANEKAQAQAQTLGQTLLSEIKTQHSSPAELSRKYNLPWQVDKDAGRYDSRVDARILSEAFRMPYPNGTPSIEGLQLPSGDYAIIAVDAVHQGTLPTAADSNVAKNVFQEELERNYGEIDYQFYVRELMKNAKIKMNTKALENSKTDDTV